MQSEFSEKIRAVDLKPDMHVAHYFETAFGSHELVGVVTEVSQEVTGSGIPYVRVRFDEAVCSDVRIDNPKSAYLYGDEGLKIANYVTGLKQAALVYLIRSEGRGNVTP